TKIKLPDHPKLHCIGSIEYKDMPNLYRQYDILLSPTVREGLPMAVMEAMGCGLSVIATDCSSLPELIDEAKGGYLCPLGDVHCFAEKINLLADSHHIRTEMGEYNRSKVESHFTLEKMVAQYRDLFSSL
ncbi:MAG: glycosyltransferase family 4 protein, partial [Gammaproteobacteria bacterium]|nr:glycosyltransferase family 4 protein [Gammaproteobacteria bacterium]